MAYVEQGATWRPVGLIALAGVVLVALIAVGVDGAAALWTALGAVAVLGLAAAGVLSARRAWTVRVGPSADGVAVLSVGRERVPLADVDTAHLRAVRDGTAGVDAGAPLLGGGGSLPRRRAGLPLRLTDGRTVLVPTRDPGRLTAVLLMQAPSGLPGPEGTLGS